MLRDHSSLPSKSKAFSTPVPVMTHTVRPSVTGDGDDICCFIMRRLPPLSGRFQRTVPRDRSTAHNDRSLPSPTLRKTCSPQTIGVAPDRSGTASFQAMFSVVDQRTGRLFSPLMPFSSGPRHCGQCSADVDTPMEMTTSAMRKRRFVMDYSERRDDSSGARVAAFIATMDDRRPVMKTPNKSKAPQREH